MGMQNTKKHFRWSRLTVSNGSRRQQGNQPFFEEKQREKKKKVCRMRSFFVFVAGSLFVIRALNVT
jgi:hypothetical protein